MADLMITLAVFTLLIGIYSLPALIVYGVLKNQFKRQLDEHEERLLLNMRNEIQGAGVKQQEGDSSPSPASDRRRAVDRNERNTMDRPSTFQRQDPVIPMGPRVWILPDAEKISPTVPVTPVTSTSVTSTSGVATSVESVSATSASVTPSQVTPAPVTPSGLETPVFEALEEERPLAGIRIEPQTGTMLPREKSAVTEETGEGSGFSFEMAIGRKVLGWLAVFLFLVGGTFFVKLAIDRGWLGPMNRFVGMTLAGIGLLVLGRFCFRRGWWRYSRMVTSAGIVTLFCSAWHAKVASLFPSTVSLFLLLATVLGGFLLSAAYRSRTIGLVALLGGFALPFLVQGGQVSSFFAYLFFLNFSTLLLVNLLRRSPLGMIALLGSLIMVVFVTGSQGAGSSPESFCQNMAAMGSCFSLNQTFMNSILIFLPAAWLLYLCDSILVVARRRRALGAEDNIRVLLIPLLFFFGARYYLMKCDANVLLFGWGPQEFLDKFDGPVALALAVIYGLVAIWSVRRIRGENPALLISIAKLALDEEKVSKETTVVKERSVRTWESLRGQYGSFLCIAFGFLALSVPLLLTDSLVASSWLTLAVLLLLTGCRYRVGLFLYWTVLFFVLGSIRLLAVDFIPNLLPIPTFISGTMLPFFHEKSFAVFYSGLLLLSLAWTVPRFGLLNRSEESKGPQTFYSGERVTNLDRSSICFGLSHIYFIAGGLFLLALTFSENFSYCTARLYNAGFACPGFLTWNIGMMTSLLISFIVYLIGFKGRLRTTRMVSFGALTILGLLCFVTLFLSHPNLSLNLALPGDSFLHSFQQDGTPAETIDLGVPDYYIPLTSWYSATLLLCSLCLIATGTIIRRSTFLRVDVESEDTDRVEYGGGLSMGIFGTVFLFFWLSFECWHYFTVCYGGGNLFLPLHSLWLLWLVFAAVLLVLGIVGRSLSLRILFYILTLVQGVSIVFWEFLHPIRNPLGDRIPLLNFDALPVLMFSGLLIFGVAWLHRCIARLADSEESERQEGIMATVWGTGGLVILWLLLSCETYRYFAGKDWFGPPEWTRLVALTLLWSVIIGVLTRLTCRFRSEVLRGIVFCLLIILLIKGIVFELVFRPVFEIPLWNFYTFEIAMVSLVVLIVCAVLHAGVDRQLHQIKSESAVLTKSEFTAGRNYTEQNYIEERMLYRILSAVTLVFLWLGMSIDVYRSISVFPLEEKQAAIFLAQMALSVLWSVFAGVLLALGFLRNNSIFRWSAILLFGLTTLKVMTVDLSNVDQLYRVIAFFTLALVLAIAAAGYQRYRPKK